LRFLFSRNTQRGAAGGVPGAYERAKCVGQPRIWSAVRSGKALRRVASDGYQLVGGASQPEVGILVEVEKISKGRGSAMTNEEIRKKLEEGGFEWKQVHSLLFIYNALDLERIKAENAAAIEKYKRMQGWGERIACGLLGMIIGVNIVLVLGVIPKH
jgi:hypothetical protein